MALRPRALGPAALGAAAVVACALLGGCGTAPGRTAGAPAPGVATTTRAGSSPATGPTAPPAGTGAPTTAAPGADLNLSGSGTAGPPTSTSPPTALSIPSLGIHTSIVRLGRNADGTAQVPATTGIVGWYVDGPEPGQPGPAVILGHVDSTAGPGVFFDLRYVKPGALVEVVEGATTVRFAVTGLSVYSKAQFPTDAVFGPVPDHALRLVTCGGPFDPATGHYLDNVVAYATEVA